MKLSLLIATINERRPSFKDLLLELTAQAVDGFFEEQMEIVTLCDRGLLSIGAKRNELLKRARAEYCAFIDDDDTVSPNYISRVMNALQSNPDCCSLTGIITWDGNTPELFEHSLKYKEYKTNSINVSGMRYERYPNHLNVIRTEIAQRFKFPEINFGEDKSWADQLHESKILLTEATIPGIIYYYQYKTKK